MRERIAAIIYAAWRNEDSERYCGDGAEKEEEDSSPFHETILREQG
jgi:hypothetical protein